MPYLEPYNDIRYNPGTPGFSDEQILEAMTQAIILDGDRGEADYDVNNPHKFAKRVLAAIRTYEQMKFKP